MRLTRESDYALRGLVFLVSRPSGTSTPLGEVAAAARLPPTFLAKTFQKLARHGMLTSHRGPGRGYALARPAADISVREVLEAIEGSDVFRRCLFLRSPCDGESRCALHDHLKDALQALETTVARLTLADLADAQQGTRFVGGTTMQFEREAS